VKANLALLVGLARQDTNSFITNIFCAISILRAFGFRVAASEAVKVLAATFIITRAGLTATGKACLMRIIAFLHTCRTRTSRNTSAEIVHSRSITCNGTVREATIDVRWKIALAHNAAHGAFELALAF
jgi:hypothetical protein